MNRVAILLLVALFCGIAFSQTCPRQACKTGECCSQWGYCGTTAEHCGTCSPKCKPDECCSQWGYCGKTSEHCKGPLTSGASATVSSSSSSSSSTSGGTTGSTGSCKLANVLSEATFKAIFVHANHGANNGVANQYPIFTYANLINAANKYYPKFGCDGDLATRRREVAAFLAQTSQETSGWWAGQPYEWGYVYSSELNCNNNNCGQYCTAGTYPCAGGKSYFGRGPLQLSHNYNYAQVSRAIWGDDRLINDPDLILRDGELAFRTSLWFWMTAQNPKPSCHNVITGIWQPSANDLALGRKVGFGMTTNVINGGLECNMATPQKVENRVQYFRRYVGILGTTTGNDLYCNTMRSYA